MRASLSTRWRCRRGTSRKTDGDADRYATPKSFSSRDGERRLESISRVVDMPRVPCPLYVCPPPVTRGLKWRRSWRGMSPAAWSSNGSRRSLCPAEEKCQSARSHAANKSQRDGARHSHAPPARRWHPQPLLGLRTGNTPRPQCNRNRIIIRYETLGSEGSVTPNPTQFGM